MSDNKDLLHEQTIMLSELLIKVTALENAILAKGLINAVDIAIESKKVVAKLTELMKENLEQSSPENSGN
jgi:hypothetical protein